MYGSNGLIDWNAFIGGDREASAVYSPGNCSVSMDTFREQSNPGLVCDPFRGLIPGIRVVFQGSA